jgi:hypothetical protein
MAGTREIPIEKFERDFIVSEVVIGGRKRQYASLRRDPGCVLIVDRLDRERGVYHTTECEEGEYGIGIIGRGGGQ